MPIPKKPTHYREAEPVAPRAPVLAPSGHDLSTKARPGDSAAMSAHHDAGVLASAVGYTASIRYAHRHNTLEARTLLAGALMCAALEQGVAALGGSTYANLYAIPPIAPGGGQPPGVVVPRPHWRDVLAPILAGLTLDRYPTPQARAQALMTLATMANASPAPVAPAAQA